MNIKASKVDETGFYDIYDLMERHAWLKDNRGSLIDLWNLCDKRSEQELLIELLDRFCFVDSVALKKIHRVIVDKITNDWKFTSQNTFISAIAKDGEVDGSIAGLQLMKSKFSSVSGWRETRLISTIGKSAHAVRNNDNLVLFDDFIGSGKTIIAKITYLNKTLKERGVKIANLKIVCYAGMEFGLNNITNEFECVEIYTPNILKKGITDYESSVKSDQKKLIMVKLEEKLGERFKKLKLKFHSLGYKGSETLYQLDDSNCPNNVFPVFWWPIMADDTERRTLFNRIR